MGIDFGNYTRREARLAWNSCTTYGCQNVEDRDTALYSGSHTSQELVYFQPISTRGLILWQPACFSYPGSIGLGSLHMSSGISVSHVVILSHRTVLKFMTIHQIGWLIRTFHGHANHCLRRVFKSLALCDCRCYDGLW